MFTEKDNKLIEKEFEVLRLAALKRCANQNEYKIVLKAFDFAKTAHNGVRRRSGEPYILHPISVAQIVVQEIGLGYKSIVSALIHDVVEDTEYTNEDIENLFGAKIASLVDGLTKIKSAFDSTTSSQAENFKRILLTLNDDVRVILIKLADRLHNMRTLESMPDHKKSKILSETMYIFIPLAHRLGLYSIKSELENIWLYYTIPTQYEFIESRIAQTVAERGCAMDDFISPISDNLTKAGYNFSISKRTKSPYSIWKKMETKSIPFEQIYDLYAVRIIFEPKDNQTERIQCWYIYSLITELYLSKTDRIRDWVSTPRVNGYEALHCTVMGPQGNWIEIQIRTTRMNDLAERGVAAHWNYKGAGITSENEMDKWLNKVREVLENPDSNALEFLERFHSDLLSHEIYVFTPKGESKSLTKGATALDFAYFIHSEIGNKAIAAKVNFKLVPLSYVLRNGDQVEIITAESQKPQREWLDFAKTPKAKGIIMEELTSEIKDHLKEGQNILDEKLTNLGITPQNRVYKKLTYTYKLNNREELFSKIGAGVLDLSDLSNMLKKNSKNKFVRYWNLKFSKTSEDEELDNFDTDTEPDIDQDNELAKPNDATKHIKIDNKKGYLLEENPLEKTLSYEVARCCKPIPGDKVIGFINDLGEVTVHKNSCPEAIQLASRYGNKIVNAKWSKHTVLSFLARIEMRGIDRVGILNELTQYITLVLSVNIRKILIETHDGIFEGFIDLYVHNTEDLEKLMKQISMIKGVENVARSEIIED